MRSLELAQAVMNASDEAGPEVAFAVAGIEQFIQVPDGPSSENRCPIQRVARLCLVTCRGAAGGRSRKHMQTIQLAQRKAGWLVFIR